MWGYKYRELFVVIPCYILAVILAFVIIPHFTSQEASRVQSYALAIGDDDSTTYKVGDGKLTFVLKNNQDQMTSSLYIYGLAISNNIRQAQIFVSDLYVQDGRAVKASNIVVQPDTISLPAAVSTTPTKVDVTIQSSTEKGKFHGWFMILIGQDITSVPLTATTDPLFVIAILWVTCGALISIGTWEIGRFFDRRKTDNQFRILTTNPEALTSNERLAKQNYTPVEEMSIKVKKIKYYKRLANPEEGIKFTLVNIFSIVFGIALFYIQLLSNPAVMELQTISLLNIISLIGIGLGIGSLGGFINRPRF
jgi:hypothetical protein